MNRLSIFFIASLALLVAACGPLAQLWERNAAVMPDTSPSANQPADAASAAVVYAGPDWTRISLTDARSGESFTLADFAGKVVFVEPMATWCSNCRAQQREVRAILDRFGADEVVFLSLSVEIGLGENVLSDYAATNDFQWRFAVANQELLNALVAQFGRSVATPPATPHFFIASDGTVSALSTGMHNAARLEELIRAVQG